MQVRWILVLTLSTLCAACSSDKRKTEGTNAVTAGAETTTSTTAGDTTTTGGGGNPVIEGDYDCSPATGTLPSLTTEVVADGFARPLFVAAAPGDGSRLFVVEQFGAVQVVENGEVVGQPFVDIEDRVQSSENEGDERGLLGLAFHPDYQQNGLFYLHYSALGSGNTTVSEFSVTADANVADASSERIVLSANQPAGNHNGGMLAFGPDGFLHIGLGDGGGGGDQFGTGQNFGSILATISRIDVDGRDAGEYGIPPGNMTGDGVSPEILHKGLRNPWRFSFDPCTGDLYIGDVGQDEIEEISVAPMGAGNLNFGWSIKEGTSCFEANSCDESGLTEPVTEYGHGDGTSITGGYVYRGSAIPALRGYYFYGDYSSERVWILRYQGGSAVDEQSVTVGGSGGITSFGQDNAGEIYIVRRPGAIQKVVAQ